MLALVAAWGSLELVPAAGRQLVPAARAATEAGIHKIKHVVIIMQENRSFDSFFGTFPGADGIPMRNGVPTVCVPDPYAHHCVQAVPHLGRPQRSAGPHDHVDAIRDIDGGKMDGFIRPAHKGRKLACAAHVDAPDLLARPGPTPQSVMGYHDAREIPNYWAWAKAFVLQDHMFESDTSWSLPAHLYLVSGWSAQLLEEGRPDELPSRRSRRPGRRPASPQNPTGSDPRLRVDRSHLSPAQAPRELGLLRLQRHAAGLRRQRDVLQGGAAEREDARDLEPDAVLRHRPG